ncbi:MAG: Cobalt-zinc-cadmium resistance protein CzcC precursor, partial [Planctomycetota bacterium]
MLKVFSIIRSLFLCLFILAGSGCLYNVHELMDHSICERSKEVIDLEPLTHFEKKSETPKSNQDLKSSKAKSVDNKIDESLEFTRYQADPNSSKDRLMVPPDLPGAQEPPIKLPKFTKENMAQRKEILAKLYPPLPVMAPEPVLASGPDGKPYSLSDLQKIALTSSPKIKQAVAAVAAARGAAIQAGLYPNPDFGYEGDTMQTMGTAGYQGGYIQQTIVTASKLPTARQAALMDVRITELSLR